MYKRIKRDRVLYLMMFPALLYFLIFHVWPILEMKLAFYDYRIIGDNIFVGWKHFKTLFSTPAFFKIIRNTLVISFMKIVLFFPFPVAFALALNEMRARRFRKAVQMSPTCRIFCPGLSSPASGTSFYHLQTDW